MDSFKNGTPVRQIMPKPITGVVTERKLDDEGDHILHHVEFTDGDGHTSARWFKAGEIEATGEAPAAKTGVKAQFKGAK